MAKKVETQLVITARELGTKKLKELASAFRQIRQEQKETAAVADRTSVSMAELRTTLSQLDVIQKQISQRRALVTAFQAAGDAAKKAATRLDEAKAALSAYQTELKQTGDQSRAASTRLRALERAVAEAEKRLASSVGNAEKLGNEIKALGLDSNRAQAELNRLGAVSERAFHEATAAADALPRQQREYREELKRTAEAQKAAEQVRKTAQEAERERVRQRIAAERQLRSGFAAFSSSATQITSNAANAAAIQRENAARERSVGIQQRLLEAERRLDERKKQSLGTTQRQVGVLGQLATAMRRSSQATDQAANSKRRYADASRTALSVTQRVRGQVLSLVSAYIGVFGAIDFARRSIDAYNTRLALNTRLLVANGNDTNAAADDYKFLRKEADRLGFSLNDLGGVYSKLSIAGRSAGLSAQEVQTIFSSFAEVARVNNASTEETGRVFRALEQILSKGKVQAEELRGQLGDVLPGAATTFAKALGVTTAELDKMLEKGQVSARTLVQFAATYREQVAGQLPNATRSLIAEFGRLQTAFQDFLIIVAEGGLTQAVRDVSRELRKFFNSAEGKQAAKDIAQAFRAVGEAVLYLLKNINTVIPVIKSFVTILAVSVVAKLGADIVTLGLGFVSLAKNIGPAITAMRTFYGTIAAGEASGAGASLLRFLKNPIFLAAAVSIGALGLQLREYNKAVAAAKTPTDEMRKALEELESARGTDEEGAARRRVEALAAEARERLNVARAAVAQARAELEIAKQAADNPLARGDLGGRAGGASGVLVVETRLKQREAELQQALNDIEAYEREILGLGKGRRGGLPMAESTPKPAVPPDALEEANADALEERKKLEEQAAQTALQVYRDRLEQQLQLDEDYLEARLKLVELEYDERLRQAEELRAKLAASGGDTAALDTAIADLKLQREIALAEERRLAAVRSRKAEEEQAAELVKQREKEIDRLLDERERKLDEIERRRQLGQLTDMEARRAAGEMEVYYQDLIMQKVQELRDLLATFDKELLKALGVDDVLAKLDEIPGKIEAINPALSKANELREQFAQGAADAFGNLAVGIAGAIRGFNSFGDAIKGAWDTFRNFIADFLLEIGKAIIKQQILNLLQKAGQNGGGFWGSIANAMLGSAHTGGIIGTQAKTRSISPLAFAMADRYHTGGVIGLGPDEVPIIAKRGEEMLTEDDPRHRGNGGMARPVVNITNAIDSGSVLAEGVNSPAGGTAILNYVRANKAAFKAILG